MMELDMEKAKEVQGYRETAIEMINKIPENGIRLRYIEKYIWNIRNRHC